MLFLKRKRTKKKYVKKFRRNIPFNKTFSVADLNIYEINLNHRENLICFSVEFRLSCRRVARNFWGQGSFLKISAKIPFFFFIGDKTACWHYSGLLSRAYNLIVMLFEIKYKRNWILRHEREGWEGEVPPCCRQLVNGGPFFQKRISHSTKYSRTNIHPAWTYSYKKRKAFLILMAWWTAAFVNTSPT